MQVIFFKFIFKGIEEAFERNIKLEMLLLIESFGLLQKMSERSTSKNHRLG